MLEELEGNRGIRGNVRDSDQQWNNALNNNTGDGYPKS